MILAVANDKGGVGKTTSAVFLAHGLARDGRVGLVDSDPSASAWQWAGVSEAFPPQLEVIKLTGDVHKVIPEIAPNYQHIVIDTPPNDRKAIGSALLVADTVVIPVTPSTMDSNRIGPTLEVLAQIEHLNRPRVYALISRGRTGTKSLRDLITYLNEINLQRLEATVPLLERYANAFGEVIAIDDIGHYEGVLAELRKKVVRG
jgi:chromosome partitioning protein